MIFTNDYRDTTFNDNNDKDNDKDTDNENDTNEITITIVTIIMLIRRRATMKSCHFYASAIS